MSGAVKPTLLEVVRRGGVKLRLDGSINVGAVRDWPGRGMFSGEVERVVEV